MPEDWADDKAPALLLCGCQATIALHLRHCLGGQTTSNLPLCPQHGTRCPDHSNELI